MPGWLVSLLATVVVGALVVVIARSLATINTLKRRLDDMEMGRRVRPVRTRAVGPLGHLTRRFNEVIPIIEGRIAKLDREAQQLRIVLGGMTEAVIAIDMRRKLLFANSSADALFGLDANSVGKFLLEIIRSPQLHEMVELTLARQGEYIGEIALISREPFPRPHSRILAVHGSPLPGSPPGGAIFVFHDVSELRRLERMRQDFVANVSHELKTPLAAIKAYTESLLDWALDDSEVNMRFLHRIEEQAERLNQLIMDLLSLARLDSGEVPFDHEPVTIGPLVKKCAEILRDRAEAKNLKLDVQMGPVNDSIVIVADDEAVRQILDNLIDNAIKYTPEGGCVRITCSLSPQSVSIEVADTGIGIPRDDLNRIFERFYRVDKARSRELGGTGLGLSIVKHLVHSIGGSITVNSRLGEGTQFFLQLPRERIAALPQSPSTATTSS